MEMPVALGIAVLAIPLILFGILFLRRSRAVFMFYIALVIVALGLLTVTGTMATVGNYAQATLWGGDPVPAPATGSY